MKKRILIIGSSGMFGTALSYKCLDEYEVFGADIFEPKAALGKSGAVKFFKLDITDKEASAGLIKKIRPDIVIHAAGYTNVDGCEKEKRKAFSVNAGGTENVASGCRETGSALFYISTDFVFDGSKASPYKETDTPNPISIYGESKLAGEDAAKKNLEDFVIIRTSWLFGKYGRNFVDTILGEARKRKELRVVADQKGSPTYTEDLVEAIVTLIPHVSQKKNAGIYHITNSGSTFWNRYAEEILEYAGIDNVKVVPVTSEELDRPAKRPKMSVLDNSLYQKTTGHKMRDYKEALREYISQRC